jgi:SAM-dependent methyltransferase
MAPRFIAQQLAWPEGWRGRVIGWLMNRHNAKINAFAIHVLDLKPGDRVLEIGFGGGLNLPALVGGAGFFAGVDRSGDVVGWARKRFPDAVRTGRSDFREGRVEALPFEAASFDKAITVNTIYFWDSLDSGFAEIHRVLVPGGQVVVGFLPKERMRRMRMPADIFALRAPEDVIAALERLRFGGVRVERPDPSTSWSVIVATRQGTNGPGAQSEAGRMQCLT